MFQTVIIEMDSASCEGGNFPAPNVELYQKK